MYGTCILTAYPLCVIYIYIYIDGLVQESRNSIVNTLGYVFLALYRYIIYHL